MAHTVMQERDVRSFMRGDQCAEYPLGQGFPVYLFTSANVDARYKAFHMHFYLCGTILVILRFLCVCVILRFLCVCVILRFLCVCVYRRGCGFGVPVVVFM